MRLNQIRFGALRKREIAFLVEMRTNARLKKPVTALYCPHVSNEYTDFEINL